MNFFSDALDACRSTRPGQPRDSQRGFTLIEIMVVVVILGILAALVAPNVIRRIDDARVTKARQDIRAYETALNLYRMDNFRYPSTEYGLESLVKRPADPSLKNWKEGGYIAIGWDKFGDVSHLDRAAFEKRQRCEICRLKAPTSTRTTRVTRTS